jgi:pectin methylesterase-like acyl-CoA thioesterase
MKKYFLFTILFLLFTTIINAQINATVAADGSGNYTTVQAAINAAPTNSATAWVIFIKNGKYYEKINVPSNKPNLQLIGESVANVLVYYDDYAGKPIAGGGTLGTQNSASVTIGANDFVAVNVTFANTFNYDSAAAAGVSGSQAVAVTVNADRVAFKNCRFIGMQDTLYTKGSGTPRHYFYKCYIDGIVDFIFGSSVAIFDSCTIYPKSRTTAGNSYITAANTPIGQTYGYLFKDCKIYNNTGNTLYFLGRPWNNATAGNTAANKVVLMNTTITSNINSLGWSIWDAGTITSMITDAEYKSKKFDGSLVDISNRVSWSKQFTDVDTVGYNILNMFSGWNPCSVRTDFCNYTTPEIAVSNFKGIKSGANTNLSWNISFPITGIAYNVYRSIDNKASYQLLSTSTAANDTAINFNGIDAVPPSCSSYFYFVQATKTGYTTTNTDTIEISSIPTINTTTTNLTNFLQGSTAPSAAQSFIVSGVNLLNNITITAPANFEISLDNTTWNVNPIVLAQAAGSVANTTVYVRLNAATANTYNGNIVFATTCSASTITKNIAVSGTTQSTPLLSFNVIQQWDLTTDNIDNATVRAIGLNATTPTFNKLYVSNGTTLATIPAYSTQFGQAFGANPNGDGSWGTAIGGPGGNLNRTYYEEFTIKPSTNYTVRVDSIVATTAFYNTSSNIKLAVVYSLSNFATDSANVTGGRDAAGLTLTGTANGAFTTPIVLANQTSGPTAQYALALNAGTGVNIGAGQTLTIRLYYACGSTGVPRYAMLKNVQVKGLVPVNLPLKITSYQLKVINENGTASLQISNPQQILNIWTTTNEVNVSHFNIQRSINGKSFETIGTIAANNKTNNEYHFTDKLIPKTQDPKTLYYRLESIDKDGSKTYSEIKTISFNNVATFNRLNIFPNPATNTVNIECAGAKQLLIIDYLGRTVKQFNNLTQPQTINTQQLSKGIYVVKAILNNGEIKTEKLVVE